MTFALESMISLFEKMFGNLFWKNTLFEVTRWHFDTRSERNRQERGESEEKGGRNMLSKMVATLLHTRGKLSRAARRLCAY